MRTCADLSQDSENFLYLYVRQLEMPNIAFQICDVITFTCFLGNFTARNKDIALKFCMDIVCMYLDHMYLVFFFENTKIQILLAIIF